MGLGAIWEGGAPDSTLAEVGSVLGSVGGLSITVGSGGGGAEFFKQSLHETRLQRGQSSE